MAEYSEVVFLEMHKRQVFPDPVTYIHVYIHIMYYICTFVLLFELLLNCYVEKLLFLINGHLQLTSTFDPFTCSLYPLFEILCHSVEK